MPAFADIISVVWMQTGARQSATEVDIAFYLAHCRASQEKLDELLETYRKQEDGYWIQPHTEQLPGELKSLIFQETTAASISNYEPLVVPGLLQTEGYAYALFHEGSNFPKETIDMRVAARMERQNILRRTWTPQFCCYIHEQALRLPVGGIQVMHEQMRITMSASDLEGLSWHKSRYSGAGNGGCVEMARTSESVAVRDSKNSSGPVLTFAHAAWRAFARSA